MIRIARNTVVVILALFAACAGRLSAQVSTGTPPFGSFSSGGPDVINLGNLNAHLDVPVLNKPGRGVPFTYDLTYDTSIWYPVGSSGSQSWVPGGVESWGWAGQTEVAVGYLSANQTLVVQCGIYKGNVFVVTGYEYSYTNWAYHDQFRASHPVTGSTTQYTGSCSGTNTGFTATASDGSGYTVQASGGSGSVTFRNGNVVLPNTNVGNGAASYTDTNGNQITVGITGALYDTLSSTSPVLTVSGSGAPSPTTFTYAAPSGANASYTMSYKEYTVATNFGISGITEYGPVAGYLVDKITLPDNSTYSFSYEPTPSMPVGHPCTPIAGTTCVTGRLASVILPTGGSITYTYSGGNNGILSDGSVASLTRVLSDGASWSATWIYARAQISGSHWQTTVTTPANDTTVIDFQKDSGTQNFYETQRLTYHGSTSGTLLQTLSTCYNTNTTNCPTTGITLPITQRNVTNQFGSSGPEAMQVYKYNTYGLPTEEDDYDYVTSGTPNVILRKYTTSYASLGNGIVGLPQQTATLDGNNNTSAKTIYSYDQGTLATSSGTPQHISIAAGVARGNVTAIQTFVSSASSLTQNFTYYDTGVINTVTDVNGALTTYNFPDSTSTCGNAFPASMSEPLSLSRSFTWACAGGTMATMKDENGQTTGLTTSITYNDTHFWRPAAMSVPDGGQSSLTYNSLSNTSVTSKITSSQSITGTMLLDGLGRTSQSQITSDPDCSTGDITKTTYDGLGRVYTVSNPYCTTGDSTYGFTTYLYDALGRGTQVTHPDGATILTSYTNRATQVQDEGNGASRVTRVSQIDGLGRTISICEVTSATQMGNGASPASCAQDIGATGFLTSYTYNPLGNILSVTQNGVNQRVFTYDYLSRLLTETNPETGTITYVYDQNTNCTSPNSFPGQLVSRTDARSIRTCLQYDTLNRITQKSYSDGTPTLTYTYDNPNAWGRTLTNTAGRMVTAATSTGNGEDFSYDPMGRVIRDEQCIVVGINGCYVTLASYNLDGSLNTLTNAAGTQFTYNYNLAANLSSVTSSLSDANHPGTLISAVHYNALGQPMVDTLGNGVTDNFGYMNRGWVTGYYACKVPGPSCTAAQMVYTFNMTNAQNGLGIAPNGNILNGNDWVNGNWVYTYDDFNRLGSALCGSGAAGCPGSQTALGFQYKFDRFGNRWQQNVTAGSGVGPQFSFNANNRIVPTGNCTTNLAYCSDAAGNLLNDGSHSYTYDAESRVTSVDSGATATYTYDAQGRRVSKVSSAGTVDYFYDMSGRQSVVTNGSGSAIRAEIYTGRRHLGTYTNGTTYFSFTDWLGTERVRAGVNAATVEACESAPYGDMQTCTNTDQSPLHFTGNERDPETNLDHTDFRQYSSTIGRWTTPDPGGLAVVDPTNPQSWNRYAYVLNNPLAYVDPTGLTCYIVTIDENGFYSSEETGLDEGDCRKAGGTWVDGGVTTVTVSSGDDGSGGSPAGGCASFYQDGVYIGNSCDGPTASTNKGGGGGKGGGIIDKINNGLAYAGNRNRCAAKYARSIASDHNVPQSDFVKQAFLGNDVATLAQIYLGPDRSEAAMSAAVSNPTPLNATALTTGAALDHIYVDTGRIAVQANGAGTYQATGAILKPLAETAGVKALSTALGGLGFLKVLYDGALYLGAVVACSEDTTLN